MKNSIFWDITPCSLFKVQRLQTELCPPLSFALVSCSAYSSTMKMEVNIPPKRLLNFNGLHHVISHKIKTLHQFPCPFTEPLRRESNESTPHPLTLFRTQFHLCQDTEEEGPSDFAFDLYSVGGGMRGDCKLSELGLPLLKLVTLDECRESTRN
jgi:hypothetical protein